MGIPENGYDANRPQKVIEGLSPTAKSALLEAGMRRAHDMLSFCHQYFDSIRPTDRILDIGTGGGFLREAVMDYLRQMKLPLDKMIHGLDLRDLRFIKPQADPFTRAEGENLPYASGSFDRVMIFDVLHHTQDPDAILREANRTLIPGGKLILSENLLRKDLSPLAQSIYKKALFMIDNTSNVQEEDQNPHNNFSDQDWQDKLTAAGFKVTQQTTWQWGIFDFIPGVAKLGLRNQPNLFRPFTDVVYEATKLEAPSEQ